MPSLGMAQFMNANALPLGGSTGNEKSKLEWLRLIKGLSQLEGESPRMVAQVRRRWWLFRHELPSP